MKRAFTLIELSIVLIIIGLLVGGILAGQELIRQAKIRADVNQFNNFDTALATFSLKYDAFPGDMEDATDFFSAPAADGDGDGFLENADGTTTVISGNYGGEYGQFWVHLGQAGLVEQQYDGSNTPEAGFPIMNLLPIPIIATADTNNTRYKVYNLRYSRPSAFPSLDGADGLRSYTPAQAFELDTKLDDGNASTGRFTASTETSNACHSGGAYTLSETAVTCRPQFRMGLK